MNWLPSLRWRRVDRGEAYLLGLETPWSWDVLELAWLGRGLIICARAS